MASKEQRPIAPHATICRPPAATMASITHRFSALAMCLADARCQSGCRSISRPNMDYRSHRRRCWRVLRASQWNFPRFRWLAVGAVRHACRDRALRCSVVCAGLFVLGVAFAWGVASTFKYIGDDIPDFMGAVSGIVGMAFLLPIMFAQSSTGSGSTRVASCCRLAPSRFCECRIS